MKTFTCKLPERLDAALEAVALEEGVSKSQVVRNALENQLVKKRGKIAARAFDLIGDLSGSVKGLADLLTNPKYMGTFGA